MGVHAGLHRRARPPWCGSPTVTPLITDGPFTEGKEHVGGFTIVRLPDLDAASSPARKLSTVTGLPIEFGRCRGTFRPDARSSRRQRGGNRGGLPAGVGRAVGGA